MRATLWALTATQSVREVMPAIQYRRQADFIGGDVDRIGGDASHIGGEAGVVVASVTGDGGHGGSDVGVDGHDGEVGSVNSEIGVGSKDDYLGGEVRKGGHGNGGEP